jgi:hypothetical protein
MNVMNRGHYQYNESSEGGEFVCNGHYPQDSAEIVCLDEKSATWLRANATFPGVRWHHARMLVVGSTEDALRIVGKAVRDGLRVTTNHIPAVSNSDSHSGGTQLGSAVSRIEDPGYSPDGPAGPGYYFERAPDGKLYRLDPSAPEQRNTEMMPRPVGQAEQGSFPAQQKRGSPSTTTQLPRGWTEAELAQACHLRALEWAAWPAFISQPLIPLLYLRYAWWAVLLVVMGATLAWEPFCTRIANIRIATFGVFFSKIKWASIPVACLVLLVKGHVAVAVLALCTPLLVGLLRAPFSFLRIQSPPLGPIEIRFLAQLGHKDSEG